MKTPIRMALLTSVLLASSATFGEKLLQTSTSWDGGDFHYPQGKAEVSSFILTIVENEAPKFHCHPVPTLGYILSGTVEVETKSGDKALLREGESIVEVMRTVHRGTAIGGEVKILVFYAGAEGIPNTVLPDSEAAATYCD
jgi:quercetin dioxygenase-like cupin family protein